MKVTAITANAKFDKDVLTIRCSQINMLWLFPLHIQFWFHSCILFPTQYNPFELNQVLLYNSLCIFSFYFCASVLKATAVLHNTAVLYCVQLQLDDVKRLVLSCVSKKWSSAVLFGLRAVCITSIPTGPWQKSSNKWGDMGQWTAQTFSLSNLKW